MFINLMLVVFLVLVVFFMSPRVWSETAPAQKKPQATKALMDQFLVHMTELKKYFVSDEKFTDPENNLDISRHLKALSRLVSKAAHDPELGTENYKLSRNVLANHVAETERVFRSGNKSYARWMVSSTFSVCMSCHAQIPTPSRSLTEFESLKSFSSPFSQAEFLFATRAFDKASDIYDGIIRGYPKNGLKTDQLETALERQVAYFSRIKRNPEEAVKKFQGYEKNRDFPEYLKNNVASWLKQFNDWSKSPLVDPTTATEAQITEFAKKNLESGSTSLTIASDNPRLVTYLRTSGILYQYLQAHPQSKLTPQILYWLSLCDRAVNNNFFFSLADLYLRECIIRYPSDPVAKKCFKEYQDETILSYSGSSGVHVPESVKQDLANLEKLVNSEGKVRIHEN